MKQPFDQGVRQTHGSSCQGAALVIILVLLTMIFLLPLAFFLQTTNQRRLASASSAMSMEATLAEGAIESILSDLVQEIAWGSVASYNVVTNVTAGTVNTNPVYYPTTSSNAVPMLAGSSGTNGLENLLKRSAFGVSNYPGASSWAISLSSTSPAANGFVVPIARWNKHMLIARAYPSSATDTTPTNTFTPPDWVLIARDGSAPTSWNTNMRWSMTNSTTVIGRYAYAMYDEGGLLDANVAGYPVGFETNISTLAVPPVGGKSGPYFADLTQIGLTNSQIMALIGWRNYVTANASGNFPNYTISDNGTNYAQAVFGNGNGFMATFNTNVASGSTNRTDHQFSTRQQLISFLTASDPGNVPKALEALRYLGNFGRDINQPSFAPATSRQRVGASDDTINPAFLSISVNTTNFTRNNGAPANVGDPLVKKRFPLNTLSWITYLGPSGIALAVTNSTYSSVRTPYTNAGIPQKMLDWGTAYNISNYYGLTWNSSGVSAGSWTYGSGSNQPIMTLAQIAALVPGRDPNFFELLKAAITYGSLGKSYSTNTMTTTPDGYNATYDNWTDAQIIQIGANIIDQFDFDSYPTRIQFSDGTVFAGASVEIRGVEDLPYLYRVREGKVMTTDSSPSMAALPATNALANAGSGVLLQEPEIWNPHAMRSLTNTNSGPTNFRLFAVTTDPLTIGTTNYPTNTMVSYVIRPTWTTQKTNVINGVGVTTNLNVTNAWLTFSIPTNNQGLFREPTLLIKPNVPTGSSLAGSATYTLGTNLAAYQYGAVSVVDSKQYLGIAMGNNIPMAFTNSLVVGDIGTSGSTNVPSNATAGTLPTGYVTYQTNGTTNAGYPAVTYLLQCQDASGNWITYDEKFASVANATNGYGVPGTGTDTNALVFKYNENKSFFVDLNNTTWSKNAIGSEWSVVAFDPRSSRFGMIFAGCNGGGPASDSFPLGAALAGSVAVINTPLFTAGWAAPIGTALTDPLMKNAAMQNAILTVRPDEYSGMTFSSTNTGPTAANWYPGGSNSLVRPGMFVQNNPNIPTPSGLRFSGDPQPPSPAKQFFADNDGVVRRGMSAFVPYTNSIPASYPISASNYPSGIPLLTAYNFDPSGNATPITSGVNVNEYLSRPIILNRPFRSVAELGIVFSGTPWRNLDLTTPESGGAALLDVFCINDTADSLALLAGKVNLNTRQIPVLQAILYGAYKEEFNPTNPLVNSLMSTNLANAVARAVITRTHEASTSAGPFINISDLVGRWNASNAVSGTSFVNGSTSFVGFTDDQTSVTTNDLAAVLNDGSVATDPELRIQRLRDASIHALASSGQTRVWNVLIDLLVQQGRFSKNSTAYTGFIVDGEVHYWVHLSIDRLTGQLLDRRVENVKE